MTNLLSPAPKQKFFANNGQPAAKYKLFTYQAGTNTKLATYQDQSTSSVNANPILLDFRGECNLWLPSNVAYKLVFCGPNDTDPPANPIWSVDNIFSSTDSQSDSFIGTLTGCVSNPSAAFYWERTGMKASVYLRSLVTGTSNSTAMTLLTLPAAIRPAHVKQVVCAGVYNGVTSGFALATAIVGTNGVVTFNPIDVTTGYASEGVFNNTGSKGLNAGWCIDFSLD